MSQDSQESGDPNPKVNRNALIGKLRNVPFDIRNCDAKRYTPPPGLEGNYIVQLGDKGQDITWLLIAHDGIIIDVGYAASRELANFYIGREVHVSHLFETFDSHSREGGIILWRDDAGSSPTMCEYRAVRIWHSYSGDKLP